MMKLSTGIIGLGNIGLSRNSKNDEIKKDSHYYTIINSKYFQLVSVCDINIKNLSAFKKNKKIKKYSDYKQMIKNHFFDLIVIATPNDTHYKILNYINNFKVKYIFCEKPLTENYLKITKIISKNKFSKIQVNYSRRFNLQLNDLKQLIKQNYLGQPKHVFIKYNRGLINNGTHFIDMILWFFGKPIWSKIIKKNSSRSINNDYDLDFIFYYKNKLTVHFHCYDIKNINIEEIDMIFSKGKIFIINEKIYFYDLVKDSRNNSLKKFRRFKLQKINYLDCLKNAYKNIYENHVFRKTLISPAKNSLDIFKFIDL